MLVLLGVTATEDTSAADILTVAGVILTFLGGGSAVAEPGFLPTTAVLLESSARERTETASGVPEFLETTAAAGTGDLVISDWVVSGKVALAGILLGSPVARVTKCPLSFLREVGFVIFMLLHYIWHFICLFNG